MSQKLLNCIFGPFNFATVPVGEQNCKEVPESLHDYVNVQNTPIIEMGICAEENGFRLFDLRIVNQRLSIRSGDVCNQVIWRDRFNQSELGKSYCNASYTFRPGESCNRLNVFPQIGCFYNTSRSFPGWACPYLASCPSFDPFLPFSPEISLFQGNG